jgi:hypothetical protein
MRLIKLISLLCLSLGTIAAAQPQPGPAGANSMAPQLSVSTRGVLLSWIERSGKTASLKFAELAGGRWSAARTVASGDDWFVNWADVPSVIRLNNGQLAAHYLQKGPTGGEAYDIRIVRSTDDGATWSKPFSPHHDNTPTEHGFVSMFQTARGGFGLIWLDGRAMSPMPGMQHGHGDMSLRYAAFDANGKQTDDQRIDARVCECCPTAIAVTADGPLAAFRNRGDDETRDIFVSRLENIANGKTAWTEPAAAVADHWQIDACPVNGPALTAKGRDVAIAWFTGKDNQNRAFAAFSKDAGRTFGNAIRLDDTKTLGRVDIERLDDGSAVASWIESVTGGAELRIRRIDATGRRSDPVTIAPMSPSRTSGYPRMASAGGMLVFAWTDVGTDGSTRVKVTTAAPPK